MRKFFTAFASILCLAVCSRADVRLPKLLTSHAVLQRGMPIHIWGWAEPGEKVSIDFNGQTASATGDRLGHWEVFFKPMPAGGPYTLTAHGATNNIMLDDLMIGDVWFASGQSNMEMPLKGFDNAPVKNGDEEIRNANQPRLRLFVVPKHPAMYPEQDFAQNPAWTNCTPETAKDFSAVAYFFGREIAQRENVTVGLIDSTWGGTPAEAWTSMDGLSADASLMPVFATWAKFSAPYADVVAMRKADEAEHNHTWHPDPMSYDPAYLYNGMVAPAIQFPIKGVIWYQGETNSAADRAPLYHRVFSTLITDWRKHWQIGEFPFLFVQISSFESPHEYWSQVREAQLETLQLNKTAMAVTIDVGDPKNVHPADKQTVGGRLALAARALAYGENIEYSGPIFRQAVPEGDSMRVFFTHTGAGLQAHGTLDGFEIAGSDRNFIPAKARIDGDSVVVTAASVTNPQFVRYAWKSVPPATLFNSDGLPASPFTSAYSGSMP